MKQRIQYWARRIIKLITGVDLAAVAKASADAQASNMRTLALCNDVIRELVRTNADVARIGGRIRELADTQPAGGLPTDEDITQIWKAPK